MNKVIERVKNNSGAPTGRSCGDGAGLVGNLREIKKRNTRSFENSKTNETEQLHTCNRNAGL
jgi:hypothetical protein